MVSSSIALSSAIYIVAVVTSVNAYSSTFTGKHVFSAPTTARNQRCNARASITMKKGKGVPANMRGQYQQQKEMSRMRDQMEAAQKPGADGFPVFNLFVRTKRANMWYPCGSFKGDERSNALATSYREDGFLAGMAKKQLDGGVSGSLYQDLARLKETVSRAYPQLRKSKEELEFGYKLAFDGLSKEQETINLIEPKEQSGPLDGLKNMFSGN